MQLGAEAQSLLRRQRSQVDSHRQLGLAIIISTGVLALVAVIVASNSTPEAVPSNLQPLQSGQDVHSMLLEAQALVAQRTELLEAGGFVLPPPNAFSLPPPPPLDSKSSTLEASPTTDNTHSVSRVSAHKRRARHARRHRRRRRPSTVNVYLSVPAGDQVQVAPKDPELVIKKSSHPPSLDEDNSLSSEDAERLAALAFGKPHSQRHHTTHRAVNRDEARLFDFHPRSTRAHANDAALERFEKHLAQRFSHHAKKKAIRPTDRLASRSSTISMPGQNSLKPAALSMEQPPTPKHESLSEQLRSMERLAGLKRAQPHRAGNSAGSSLRSLFPPGAETSEDAIPMP